MNIPSNYLNMLTSMEQTIDALLSEGRTKDALVLLSSESIIRAHFGSRPPSPDAIRGQSDLVNASSQAQV